MMEQVNVTLIETIKVLLDDKKFSTLRDILITMKPFDIAAVFENRMKKCRFCFVFCQRSLRRKPLSKWMTKLRNFLSTASATAN